jgi:hypothetical protein
MKDTCAKSVPQDTFAARSELTKIRSRLRIQKHYEAAMFASRLIEQLEHIEKPSTLPAQREALLASFNAGLKQFHRQVAETFRGEDDRHEAR